MNFMKGVVILTVLLMSVTISFFMGRILGSELMESGKEKLESFTGSDQSTNAEHPALAGAGIHDYSYEGPTANRFPADYISEIPGAGDPAVSAITIEPVDGSTSSSGGGMSNPFTLDPDAENTDTRKFQIQVGVFTEKENAETLVADLLKESYQAYAQKVEFEQGDFRWKVYVGPYPTRERAHVVAEELRAGNYDAYVN